MNQWTGRTPVLARLQRHISTTPTATGCLEWTGSTTAKGYGRFNRADDEPETTAHRAVWEEAHGPLPPGQVVRHTCDNPPCCRLSHLRAGTHQDNEQDKTDRGRRPTKLTKENVLIIRSRPESQNDLARRFGVSKSAIKHVQRGRSWPSDPSDDGIVRARP